MGKKTTKRKKLSDSAMTVLKEQQKAFEKKFGRPPGDDDPVFFDPDANEPAPMSQTSHEKSVLDAMQKAGTSPQIIYAYKKTGLILAKEHLDNYPPEAIEEWEDAIDEYFALEDAAAG